jgi:predicted esterase
MHRSSSPDPSPSLAARVLRHGVALGALLLAVACGGGGGDGTADPFPPPSGGDPYGGAFDPRSCYDGVLPPTTADPAAPVIALQGERTVVLSVGASWVDPGATATDPHDGDLGARLVVTGQVDTAQPGDFLVRYDVTDAAGHAAIPATRVVRVVAPGGAPASRTARPTGSTNADMGYYERLPASYGTAPAQRFPVILYIHGSGEMGTDVAMLSGGSGRDVTALIDPDQGGGTQSFVVLYPQRCAYVVLPQEMRAFIDFATQTYDVDPDRVYLVGLSAGASQIWSYLESDPGPVAAAVPMSGVDISHDPCTFANVPQWVFAAADDTTVSYQQSVGLVGKIDACRPAPAEPPRLTIYPTGGHVIDTGTLDLSSLGLGESTYDVYDPDVYTWLLSHRRGGSD